MHKRGKTILEVLCHSQALAALLGSSERGDFNSQVVNILVASYIEAVSREVHAAVLLDGLAIIIVGIADNDTALCFLGQVTCSVADDPRLLSFAFQETFAQAFHRHQANLVTKDAGG